MPATEKRNSGKTSAVIAPATWAARSCGRVRGGGAHRGEGVGADAAEAFGQAERGQQGEDQNGALDEQGRPVDDDGAGSHAAVGPGNPRGLDLMVDRAQDQRQEGGNEGQHREADLHGIPVAARGERLDDDAEHRAAEDDEHRQQRDIVQVGRDEGRWHAGEGGGHRGAPSAVSTTGAGSLTWIELRIRPFAGVTRSRTGFG